MDTVEATLVEQIQMCTLDLLSTLQPTLPKFERSARIIVAASEKVT